jgi:hypothetical protein
MKKSDNYIIFSLRWQLAVIVETLLEFKLLISHKKRTYLKKINKGRIYNYVDIGRYN